MSKSSPHKNFWLILASEFTIKIPASLLLVSFKASYEFSEGVK